MTFIVLSGDSLGHTLLKPFAFIAALNTDLLASSIHKTDVNRRVDSVLLHIDYMSVLIVGASEDHSRTRTHLEIELIKNTLGLIQLNQILIEVISHIEGLNRLFIAPDVPNLN